MKKLKLAADYKKLTFSGLKTPEFSHLWLLLYWPLYGIAFFTLERLVNTEYHYMECTLDGLIPFCEYFLIPYYFWFVYLIGMIVYSMLFNVNTFKKLMWFIIITNTLTMIIYAVYPTAQNLRPQVFEHNNIFTSIVGKLYSFDTNTNVCPSLHVTNSVAVLLAALTDENFRTPFRRFLFAISAILICMSTVFLKQHSVIDVVSALVLCAVCYPFVFSKKFSVENFIGIKRQKKINFVKNQ